MTKQRKLHRRENKRALLWKDHKGSTWNQAVWYPLQSVLVQFTWTESALVQIRSVLPSLTFQYLWWITSTMRKVLLWPTHDWVAKLELLFCRNNIALCCFDGLGVDKSEQVWQKKKVLWTEIHFIWFVEPKQTLVRISSTKWCWKLVPCRQFITILWIRLFMFIFTFKVWVSVGNV